MRFLLPTALLFLCIGVCQAASPSLYIAPQAAGDSSGSSCPNAHPFAFFNNPDNWGTDLGQISPGTTLHVCGPIPHETKSILTAQRDGKPGAQIVVTLEKGASPQRLAELVDLNGKKNVVLNEPQLAATPEKAVAVPHVVAPTFTVYQNANSVGEGPRNYCGADTGTANAYACANPANAAIKAYRQGNTYSFTAVHANTGVSTLAIDGLAATTIKKQQGLADLAANDILANATVQVLYDGTWFELISPLGNTASGSGVLLQTNGTSNATQNQINFAGLNGLTVSSVGTTEFFLTHEALTVSTLPSAATNSGQTYFVNDGANTTDCTTGHGGFLVPCKSNGTAWAYQSGATDPIATSSAPGIVQPDNSTITVSGSGVISAVGAGTNSTTLNAATGFGAIGDGTLASFSNASLPSGSISYTASWPSPAPVVGDALVIYYAGTGTAGNYSQGYNVMTTITAVSGSQITWATPTSNNLSNTTVAFYYGHDNTTALNNWANACSNTPEAKCYLPAGVYLTHGHHIVYGAIQVYGDGMANTIIKDIDPAQDVLLLKNALTGKTLIPVSWQPGAYVHDIGFAGTGMETSGSLLVVDNSQMTTLEHLMFYGHGGPGLNLYSGERVKMQDMWWSETKRAIINSEATINESSLSHFDIQSDGCVSDNQGPSGAYYNTNINAVNGIMPTSGTLIENPRSAITLYAVANFTIADGSIKPSLCNGGIQITDSVHTSEISHVYFENAGGNPAFSFIFGGPWIESPLATELTPSSTGGDLTDGSWMPDLIGNVADATGNNFYPGAIVPPDYNPGGSGVLSSICPAGSACATGSTPIYQNTVEYVYIKWILHDTVGSRWHPSYNARHLGGSTYGSAGVDWPAGAIFIKQYQQASAGPIALRGNNHNLAGSIPNGTSLDCNDEIGHVCGEVAAGIWPGRLNVPGTAQFVSQARGIYFDGSGKMGTGGSPADGTIEAPNSAWFWSGTPYNYTPFTNTTTTGGTSNTLVPVTIGTGSAQLRRATYPNTSGGGPDVKWQDPVRIIEMNGATNPNGFFPTGAMQYNAWGIGSSMDVGVTNYLWGYAFNDSYSCGSNNTPCWSDQWLGSDSLPNAGGPGKRERVYTGSGLGTVDRLYLPYQSAVTAAGGAYGEIHAMNLGDTKPTAGETINNAVSLLRVKTSTATPTIAPHGTTGSTTYSYCVAAYQWDGTHTACSPAGSTSTGNATLSVTNYNTITWSGFTGFPSYYNVFCTAGCSAVGIVNAAPIPAGTSTYNNTSATPATVTATPLSNNTGSLFLGDTAISGSVSNDTAYGLADFVGTANTVRIFDDGGLALIPTGTQTSCTATNRGEMWTTFNANSVADSFQVCQRTATGTYAWSSVGGGSGTVTGVSINSTPCTISSGNANCTLPPLVAAPASGLSFVTSGGNVNASAVAPMDSQPAGTSYTLPTSDCTGTGGFLVVGLSGSGSTTIGVPQSNTGGNMAAGCSVTIINASASTVTLSIAISTYNGSSSSPTIAPASGQTYHSLKLVSVDSTHYVGSSN